MRRLFRYKLPLNNGKTREGLVLQCGDRFGEIAPLPGFSKETLEEAQSEVLEWIQYGKQPILPSVRWGIECAQHSLRSVCVPLAALVLDQTLSEKKGFPTMKLKLGHLKVSEAVAFVKKYDRKATLRLDCNRAWDLNQALEFASYFHKSDFEYLEEPVQTVEELIEFSKISEFPIALDESIQIDWNMIPSLKAIVVKPMILGGIPPIPSHLQLILSSSYESGLGLLHIAHRASHLFPVGLDTYCALAEDLLTHPIDCSSGYFSWEYTNPYIEISKLDLLFLCAL